MLKILFVLFFPVIILSLSKTNFENEPGNSTLLLLDFSKKFHNIVDKCNESSEKFCSLARTELLPILTNLLKTEKLKQDPVQQILGHGRNCLFRNRLYPEYFYAAGDWLKQINNDNRLVLTWLPGWFDDECYWDIERVESLSNNGLQYRIKNKKYGEYLHAAADLHHDDVKERRFVFTWRKHGARCDEQCLWELKMIKTEENKVYFAVQNVETREFLYAVDDLTYETNSRYVFTQKYKTMTEIIAGHFDAQWIIECK